MIGGSPHYGLSSALTSQPRQPRLWKWGAGRRAVSSPCCAPLVTKRAVSTPRHRRDPGTAGSNSSAMTCPDPPPRSLRALRCTMWPTWVRCWIWPMRRWCLEVCWWSWNGRGNGFDEATARWCFDRLPQPEGDPGWLDQRRAAWRESGQPWTAYCRSWAEAEGLHAGQEILRELRARFDSEPVTYGPYFFPDLVGISEADEQVAIDRGQIQANRIQYVGRSQRSRRLPAPPA